MSYNLAGLPLGYNQANGVSSSFSYNERYLPSAISADSLIDYTYDYDSRGNTTAINNELDASKDQDFTYDNLNRVRTFNGAWGNGLFTYDAGGNRLKKTVAGVSTYYHYSSTKRLYSTTGGEPLTCAYNSSGHLTSGSMNGTSYGLTYDGFNQVRTIQLDSLTELEAGYDGDGLRVMKSGYYGTTIYHYDPAGNVLSENDDNGQKIADYVYLNGKLIAKIAVNAGSQEERYYYHTDQTGTVLAISNAAEQKVWEADYKPFGEEYNIIASEENTKRFAGKEKDIETGLNYFGARYLYAGIGRFLAPDPVRAVDAQSGQINAALLVNPQRHNVYAYSLNNPYRYVDSDGLWAEAVLFEIPSIAVGAHSLVDNIKQGNWSAAVVDAGGVAVDVVAAAIPGVPGGVGLSVKATRAMNVARKAISPVFKTTKEAAVVAKKLGFYKIKQTVHGGEAVFKRGKLYITRDIDGHHGGAWKMAKSIEDLGSKKTRGGTYNIDLTKRIGD